MGDEAEPVTVFPGKAPLDSLLVEMQQQSIPAPSSIQIIISTKTGPPIGAALVPVAQFAADRWVSFLGHWPAGLEAIYCPCAGVATPTLKRAGGRVKMATGSLRPTIVRVMTENQGRPLSTGEIYGLVADADVPALTRMPSGTATWSTANSRTWPA